MYWASLDIFTVHITVHLPAEFRSSRTIRDIHVVMTSYQFSNMAATTSQFYRPPHQIEIVNGAHPGPV